MAGRERRHTAMGQWQRVDVVRTHLARVLQHAAQGCGCLCSLRQFSGRRHNGAVEVCDQRAHLRDWKGRRVREGGGEEE